MDVTKPYKSIWFGDIDGPKPYTIRRVSMGVYFADTGTSTITSLTCKLMEPQIRPAKVGKHDLRSN